MAIQEGEGAAGVRDVDTLIIGAGQAGLATAHALERRGGDCLVVDAERRVGDNWRHQYDSLSLYTPNRFNALPGMPFPGDPRGFAHKDEAAAYLEAYAAHLERPVQLDCRVHRLARHGDWFRAETAQGVIDCRSVVVATSPLGRAPAIPAAAAELDPAILQLHSSEYRRPNQLREGPVLVVGGGHSGCDIALELARTHPTTLAGRDPGQVPVPWDKPIVHLAVPMVMAMYRWVHVRRAPHGRRLREHVLHHGAPMLRVKRAHLAEAGVTRTTARMVGARDGQPLLADGTVVEAASVVWATGFRHEFGWLDLPVLDAEGWPREYRGVAADVDGLYFCGLAWQHSMASMVIFGAGSDAAHVARRILARSAVPARRPRPAAAGAR
ncbi:putative flavoprotein involved in K+ transport [Agrococcus baldri]|uniref:Flavoprotein involved in K+ transport n=1 Tax=Agrococcus baldri TaxID=153730 RepID=A0AA94HKM7_9MICO|nr:NAD(P)/FAD-dependent oxidoreductase [Agrococcus baldri]SFS01206.1 putative flavoprotein involved in K+ transport [Agrococcus baldri]